MKVWDTDDAWESDDGRFVSLEDHEAVVEQFLAVFRMVGIDILADRNEDALDQVRADLTAQYRAGFDMGHSAALTEAREAVDGLHTPSLDCTVRVCDVLTTIDALRGDA